MFKRNLEATMAACVALLVLGLALPAFAGDGRVAICHATSAADGHYNYLELPPNPLDAHFDEFGNPLNGHERDFFPEDTDCDRTNDDPGGDPPGPGPVPEPITVLLFGAGVAGVGYASRRFRRNKPSADGEK